MDFPGGADPLLRADSLLPDGGSILSFVDELEPALQARFHRAREFRATLCRSGVLEGVPQYVRSTSLIGTPVSLLLSFTIAYHLDHVRFMHGFIRALYFLPFLTTAAAMAWVWRWFYQPVPIGLFNDVLVGFGLPQQPFLRSTTQALPSVLAPAIWAGLGFQVVIFLAGLRAIPTTYYEAARIDGVSQPDDPARVSRCRCSSRRSSSSSCSRRSASCASSTRSTT